MTKGQRTVLNHIAHGGHVSYSGETRTAFAYYSDGGIPLRVNGNMFLALLRRRWIKLVSRTVPGSLARCRYEITDGALSLLSSESNG